MNNEESGKEREEGFKRLTTENLFLDKKEELVCLREEFEKQKDWEVTSSFLLCQSSCVLSMTLSNPDVYSWESTMKGWKTWETALLMSLPWSTIPISESMITSRRKIIRLRKIVAILKSNSMKTVLSAWIHYMRSCSTKKSARVLKLQRWSLNVSFPFKLWRIYDV